MSGSSMTKEGAAPLNDELFSEAYEELRRLARRVNGGRASVTWNPTAMVNEAYVRLAESKGFQASSAEHLKHTIIRAMKYLLVEAARRKAAVRRGGGSTPLRKVPLDGTAAQSAGVDPDEMLSVSFALDELAQQSAFQALVFEYQFFGGLEVAEIAGMVGTSDKKVQRSLRLAKAFLSVALSRGKVE
jgi:RNA polymerase sigma factor (TIGR02999 family)